LRIVGDRKLRVVILLALVAVLGGCATAKFIPTGQIYPSKPEHCDIEVFTSRVPERPYEEIGIIEGEGSLGAESLEDVLPEMIKEACKAGGDGLILLSSEHSVNVGGSDDFIGSNDELHTVGTVIVWIGEE
jgi:hypothetical protein